MTTQTVTAILGSTGFSRKFNATSTDGQWSNVTSTNSDQALGLEVPLSTISFVQGANDAEPVMLWRIIDGRSLVVRRTGMSYVTGYGCMESAKIQPYQVQPQDLLQVYGLETSADNKNNVLGHLYTPQGVEPFGFAASADDGTFTAVVNINTGQSLGDYAFSSVLLGYEFQLDPTHQLQELQIVDQTGGVIYSSYGSNRLPIAGGKSIYYNIKGKTNIPIMKGYTLKLKCESNN